jgi:hypothetical protein
MIGSAWDDDLRNIVLMRDEDILREMGVGL